MLHHDLADRLGRDLRLATAFEFAHDGGHHLLHPLRFHRALAQRDLQRAHQLVAVERHPAAVALDDGQFAKLHALEGGETEVAGDAYAPAPDHGGILRRTGVLHLRIETVAAWATHADETLLINRETIGERLDPFLHRRFH